MLKKIRIKGCFTHQDSTFEFKEGMTAITGPNGRGKSLIQEMIQFAYWGIAALRGVADDYKELSVELESWIKGKPYTIHRTISKATLFEGHDNSVKLASGTKAVNQAIKELFGYSMAVFQVANAINQKQVDKFCEMLPTARKKLVDETIGLSALDTLVKWVAEQELSIRTQLATRRDLLVKPVEPVKPEPYLSSTDIAAMLGVRYAERRERDVIAAKAAEVVEFPKEVQLEIDDYLHGEYVEQSKRFTTLAHEAVLLQNDINSLPAFNEVPDAKLEEDDELLESYREQQNTRMSVVSKRSTLQNLYNLIPAPKYTLEQLDAFDNQATLLDRWIQKRDLMDKGVNYHCEKCGHDGHMHDPRVEAEFADVPDEMPARPEVGDTMPLRRILDQQGQKQDLERQIFECDEFLSVNPDRTERITAILAARKRVKDNEQALRTKQRYDELMAKRADLAQRLTANPDRSADVVRIENTRTAVHLYVKLKQQTELRHQEVVQAKAKLATFDPNLDKIIADAEAAKNLSLVYETNLAAYEKAKALYDAEIERQRELEAELEDWAKGKQSISDLRTRIKGFLLPSLNKVASYLLNEFTGGELSWLVINDDFEVIVEGKRVETLSGGGKTVANLAIRIGLGQVLTNQVFPVLMADEPDESCDDKRAEFIERTLGVLKEKFKQIILVTHKTGRIADHRIAL